MQIEKSLFYQRLLFIAFWIRATFYFVADEFFPILASLGPAMLLAFDATIVAIGVATMHHRRDIIFATVFVVVSAISTCYLNHLSISFYVNGLRDFLSYLFLIPIVKYFLEEPERRERFIEAFDRNMFWFLVVQVPCALYQFIVYGAGDLVGGSLGHWYSGVLSTMVFGISFYLIKKRMDPDNYLISLWKNKIYILLLIPTQLNETKISFIFILMYFLLLLPLNRKLFLRLLFAIPAMFLVMWGALAGYVVSNGGNVSEMFSMDYYMENYLYSADDASVAYAEALFDQDDDDYVEDVPRFSKLLYLSDLNEQYPGRILTGFGVGQFKGGTVFESSQFFKDNEWILVGTIPYIFHVIVQLGLVGVGLMVWFFWNLFSAPQSGMKRDYGIQLFFVMTFTLIMFYNDSVRQTCMMLPFVFIIMESWHSGEVGEIESDNLKVDCNEN